MFQRVVNYEGFWKSVFLLAGMFCVVYIIIDFFFTNNSNFDVYTIEHVGKLILGGIASGCIYGFIVSYFKFKGKIKEQARREDD
ncbi:MAG: hypothetical protein ACTIKA_04890 [Psychroflexus halocasei]|uniref:hypothetical protein n=1 Tax=Psychroflexus sp. S27 TaxID=1982757 RepID=UPI000C2AD673|nr:hypothetical protein [Psychroflexus sp. S27]PJX20069.1 hypothetical protein CAP47_12240 [Psychroflexus sp. S27]